MNVYTHRIQHRYDMPPMPFHVFIAVILVLVIATIVQRKLYRSGGQIFRIKPKPSWGWGWCPQVGFHDSLDC